MSVVMDSATLKFVLFLSDCSITLSMMKCIRYGFATLSLNQHSDHCSTAVFFPSKIQGMIRGHGIGGASESSHIKAFEVSHSHIKGNFVLKACWADMP